MHVCDWQWVCFTFALRARRPCRTYLTWSDRPGEPHRRPVMPAVYHPVWHEFGNFQQLEHIGTSSWNNWTSNFCSWNFQLELPISQEGASPGKSGWKDRWAHPFIIHPSPFSKFRCVNTDPSLKGVGKHRLRMSPFWVHDARASRWPIDACHPRRSNTSMRATPSSQWRRFQKCRRCHVVAAGGWRCQSLWAAQFDDVASALNRITCRKTLSYTHTTCFTTLHAQICICTRACA